MHVFMPSVLTKMRLSLMQRMCVMVMERIIGSGSGQRYLSRSTGGMLLCCSFNRRYGISSS